MPWPIGHQPNSATDAPTAPSRHGMPLRRRLLISSLLGVIPLLLLGGILLYGWYNTRKTYILQANLEQAQLAATYVGSWVSAQITTLQTFVVSREVSSGSKAEIQGLIDRQTTAQSGWENLFVTDATGKEITSYLRSHVDVSKRDYFQDAKRTLQPSVSDGLVSLVTDHRIIIIAVPILRNGVFTGVVGAAIRPQQIQQVFSRLGHDQRSTLSLWGSDRRLIARTNTPDRLLGQRYVAPDTDIVLSGHSGARITRSPMTDERVLIGFTPVENTAWTVVSATPVNIALAPVYGGMALFLVLSSFVVLITLVWSIYSANVIAHQVSMLAESAREIGTGHLATRVQLSTGDELSDLAESLNKMAADLQVIDRLKSDLLSMVSHELKTPLTSIRTSLELLTSGMITPDHARYHELLEIANRQAHRLQDMIENLLSVARLEDGGLAMVPRPTRLSSIITPSVQQYQELARTRGLELVVEGPEELRVNVDAARITLAVNNLLDNAVKFTVQGRITLQTRANDGFAVVTVSDTGVGLTPDVRARLFERFYQAEPLLTRKAGGAGIGLFVTKAIVEAHGGSVFADSPGPGQGSTFGFTLPLVKEPATTA